MPIDCVSRAKSQLTNHMHKTIKKAIAQLALLQKLPEAIIYDIHVQGIS